MLLAYVGFARRRERTLRPGNRLLCLFPHVEVDARHAPFVIASSRLLAAGAHHAGRRHSWSGRSAADIELLRRLLLMEKIPFLMLTAVPAIITFAPSGEGALARLDHISFSARFANVLISYSTVYRQDVATR